jgi:hypothetical protein
MLIEFCWYHVGVAAGVSVRSVGGGLVLGYLPTLGDLNHHLISRITLLSLYILVGS